MSTLADQVAAFAKARGLTVRDGPQPQKPITAREPSIGRTQPIPSRPLSDPYIDYTDDFTLWSRVTRGE